MIMLAWPSSLQLPTSTIVTADATEAGVCSIVTGCLLHFASISSYWLRLAENYPVQVVTHFNQ